jgi:sarcosine oxidase subunit gamma
VSDSTTSTLATAAASAFSGPFSGHAAHQHPTRDGLVQVHLHAESLASVTLISTWMGGTQALCAALGQALAATDLFPLPAATGQTAQCPLGLLLRTGPHEFMLIGSGEQDALGALRAHITPDIGAVLDLSHARCRVHIEGPQAVATLGKLFALDFREAAFSVGHLKLTGHHHVPYSLHRLGAESFDLYLLSTYAHGQLESLIDAALEYGVALKLAP